MMDLTQLLGATDFTSVEKITLYLPDRSKPPSKGVPGEPIPDIEKWVEAGMTLLASINDGVTRLPPADAMWRTGDYLCAEKTTLIYSYIDDGSRFEREAFRIARFAHTFGRRTNQAKVFVEWSGEAYVPDDDGNDVLQYIARAYRIPDYPQAVSETVPLDELVDHLTDGLALNDQ